MIRVGVGKEERRFLKKNKTKKQEGGCLLVLGRKRQHALKRCSFGLKALISSGKVVGKEPCLPETELRM